MTNQEILDAVFGEGMRKWVERDYASEFEKFVKYKAKILSDKELSAETRECFEEAEKIFYILENITAVRAYTTGKHK